jgi:hypothetical protein
MSGRSTSKRQRMKARIAAGSPTSEGAAAARAGLPVTANPYSGPGFGKARAWQKGHRAEKMRMRDGK